jgi:hypothetical protein
MNDLTPQPFGPKSFLDSSANGRDSQPDAFSEVDRHVLLQAADILKVPFSELANLRPAASISNSTAPECVVGAATGQRSLDEGIADDEEFQSPVVMNTQSFAFVNWKIDANSAPLHHDNISTRNLPPQDNNVVVDDNLADIFADIIPPSTSIAPQMHVKNPFDLRENDLGDVFTDHFPASSLDFATNHHTQEVFDVPAASFGVISPGSAVTDEIDYIPDVHDAFAMLEATSHQSSSDNNALSLLGADPWHKQGLPTESLFGLADQRIISEDMLWYTIDESVTSQAFLYGHTTQNGMAEPTALKNIPFEEISINNPSAVSMVGITSLRPTRHGTSAQLPSGQVGRPLTHRPLYSASKPKHPAVSRQAAGTHRDHRRGKNGEIRKQKRRGPLKPDERIETSQTRKINACVRCHMQRTRVSYPNAPEAL